MFAHVLANKGYLVFMLRDDTNPSHPVYRARNYELPNCVAEADTAEAALQKLLEKRADCIERLLDAGTPVPLPYVNASDSANSVDHILI